MNKLTILAILILSTVTLAGCGDQNEKEIDRNVTKTTQTLPVNYHGEPSSKGPTINTDQVKAPLIAPPDETNVSAQSVTQNENIKLTLPLKTE
jgi:predicted small lipoprotein YifL